jgi:hypothetical protein
LHTALPAGAEIEAETVGMLLMLEDNAERIQRFGTTLRAIDPAMRLVVWRNARKVIREVEGFLPSARLIPRTMTSSRRKATRAIGSLRWVASPPNAPSPGERR